MRIYWVRILMNGKESYHMFDTLLGRALFIISMSSYATVLEQGEKEVADEGTILNQ